MQQALSKTASLNVNPKTFTVSGVDRFVVVEHFSKIKGFEIGPGFRLHCLDIEEGSIETCLVKSATIFNYELLEDAVSALNNWVTPVKLGTVWRAITCVKAILPLSYFIRRAPVTYFNVSSGHFEGVVFVSSNGSYGWFIDAAPADQANVHLCPQTAFVVPT